MSLITEFDHLNYSNSSNCGCNHSNYGGCGCSSNFTGIVAQEDPNFLIEQVEEEQVFKAPWMPTAKPSGKEAMKRFAEKYGSEFQKSVGQQQIDKLDYQLEAISTRDELEKDALLKFAQKAKNKKYVKGIALLIGGYFAYKLFLK
tara:strand:+ start:1588 stop:2022 length:435 start_codon:yes stop_codon:yes gene_type:complete